MPNSSKFAKGWAPGRSASDIPSRPDLEELQAPRSGIAIFAPLELTFTIVVGLRTHPSAALRVAADPSSGR